MATTRKSNSKAKSRARPKAKVKAKARTKAKAKPKAKAKSKRKAFGGYAINFAGRKETAEQIFGNKPIPPSEMTKKIWTFVKSKKLSNK